MLETVQSLLDSLGFEHRVEGLLAIYGLGMARLIPLFSLSPIFGGKAVPPNVKVGLAVVLTSICVPTLYRLGDAVPQGVFFFVALLVKEASIGALIGLITQLIFYGIQMAGGLIDSQRGANMATFVAPQLPGNVSLFGQLKFQAALVLFVTLNLHHYFLRAIQESFLRIPVLTFPQAPNLQFLVDRLITFSATIFIIAIQVSGPVLVVLFLTDIALGMLGRVAPQMNLLTQSLPVKGLLAVAIVFLSAGFVLHRFETYFVEMLSEIRLITQQLG